MYFEVFRRRVAGLRVIPEREKNTFLTRKNGGFGNLPFPPKPIRVKYGIWQAIRNAEFGAMDPMQLPHAAIGSGSNKTWEGYLFPYSKVLVPSANPPSSFVMTRSFWIDERNWRTHWPGEATFRASGHPSRLTYGYETPGVANVGEWTRQVPPGSAPTPSSTVFHPEAPLYLPATHPWLWEVGKRCGAPAPQHLR